MFIFACLYTLGVQKRTSSEAAKKAAVHSPLRCWLAATLHSSQSADVSESRTLRVLRRAVYPHFAPLLGCVKWLNKTLKTLPLMMTCQLLCMSHNN